MSRTIRRIKNVDPTDDRGYTHDDDVEHANLHGGWKKHTWKDWKTGEKHTKWFFSQVAWGGRKVIPLEGNAFKRGWWKYHRDHHRNWCGAKKLNRADWGQVRNKNRKDLCKWLRDPEHEVFFWEDVNTQDWD